MSVTDQSLLVVCNRHFAGDLPPPPPPFYGPFSEWDHPGEPVPEESFLRTLWC